MLVDGVNHFQCHTCFGNVSGGQTRSGNLGRVSFSLDRWFILSLQYFLSSAKGTAFMNQNV